MINVEVDKLFTVKFAGNTIASEAFSTASAWAQDKGLGSLAQMIDRVCNWGDASSIWRQWEIKDGPGYKGKWTKRFSSWAYNEYSRKYDPEILAELGEIIRRHVMKEEEVHFEFAKYSDWRHGSFEPSSGKQSAGTCWWDSYAHIRKGLVAYEHGYSVLFYENEQEWKKNSKVKGIGRCWMVNDKDGAIIFNGYGRYSLTDMANVLAKNWKMSYNKITLASNDKEATGYINGGVYNNEGRSGGTAGIGYIIGEKDVVSTIPKKYLPDLRIKDTTCHICGTPQYSGSCVSDRLEGKVIHICGACRQNHSKCYVCLDWKNRVVDVRGRTVCLDCTIELPGCRHGLLLPDMARRIWHTQRFVCDRCMMEGIATTCDMCGRLFDADRTKHVKLRVTNIHLCQGCLGKIRRQDV